MPRLNKKFQGGKERCMPRVVFTPNNGAKMTKERSAAICPKTCVLSTAAAETSVIAEHCQRPAPSRFWHAHLLPLLV